MKAKGKRQKAKGDGAARRAPSPLRVDEVNVVRRLLRVDEGNVVGRLLRVDEGDGVRPRPRRLVLLIFAFCLLPFAFPLLFAANAQDSAAASKAGDALVVDGSYASDVFGLGRDVRVRGEVNGVIAFGGDVIIEGKVTGDAAAIGGSVIQREGSYVGGDVMVFGGSYRQEGAASRNPASLLAPQFSLAFVGWRLLAVLFWFVVSIALTAVSPGAVSRAAARLQLTFTRVTLIGLLGGVVIGPGVAVSLEYLPTALSALVSITLLLLLLLSYLFGRVVVHAATGRWLQRILLPEGKRSESVALLLGAVFWAVLLALPYVWPLLVVALVVLGLGLSLTARYRLNWRRA